MRARMPSLQIREISHLISSFFRLGVSWQVVCHINRLFLGRICLENTWQKLGSLKVSKSLSEEGRISVILH